MAQSYPTAMSRVIALVALAVIWIGFGTRALHESWAPSPLVTLAVAAGLFTLSKNFNVNVQFRPPRDPGERQLVDRLRLLNRSGFVGMLVSVVWLCAAWSDNFIADYIVPLCIFVVSASLQGTSAVLYRPFVVRDEAR